MMAGEDEVARGFFSRQRNRKLKPQQAENLENLSARLMLDLEQPALEECARHFPDKSRKLHLEIGFGSGEHLWDKACNNPADNFIGCEAFVNGMAKVVNKIATWENTEKSRDNIRLFGGDAARLIHWLPDNSLDYLYILYPDPWPKRRHWKRRFINSVHLQQFARICKPGAIFYFASDIADYINWTLAHILRDNSFIWKDNSPSDIYIPWDGWPSTRYEQKALKTGRTPCYLTFVRR